MAATALLASYLPQTVFTLEVRPGEIVPCIEAPSSFRLTMAALNPYEPAQPFDDAPNAPPRAVLKLIRHNTPLDLDEFDESDDDDEDGSDVEAIQRRLGLVDDDEDESDSDEEANVGPSDPEKVAKARIEAATKHLANGVDDGEAEDVDMANGVNGTKVNKGKAKATAVDEVEDDEDDSEDEEADDEEFVLCTLDPERHYQQPLDLTITDPAEVSFQVVGTHSIHLTGNYIEGPDEEDDEDDDDFDEELNGLIAPYKEDEDSSISGEESDELDDMEDPRIEELESDEEEAPKLIKAAKPVEGKGKNKRPAESDEEEGDTLDNLISKTMKPADEVAKVNGEQKLSKKQLKKLKKNDGQAAPGAEQPVPQKKAETKLKAEDDKKSALKDSPGSGKKVQFAKELEQGPTGSPKVDAKPDAKKENGGVRVVQGVKVDDRKAGSGPGAKKGDRVGMRYIGKLEKDGKQFDANKKGAPFKFKLGASEVIKGWDIGIAGMKVGGERRLTIPAHLAYGSKAMPGIPSNSSLVFDVKLLTLN